MQEDGSILRLRYGGCPFLLGKILNENSFLSKGTVLFDLKSFWREANFYFLNFNPFGDRENPGVIIWLSLSVS